LTEFSELNLQIGLEIVTKSEELAAYSMRGNIAVSAPNPGVGSGLSESNKADESKEGLEGHWRQLTRFRSE